MRSCAHLTGAADVFPQEDFSGRAYLQIVESRRDGAQVRQQVIATLGRDNDLRESGQLERLLRSGARFSTKAMVVDAVHDGSATVAEVRRLGPALVFERLWETTGCRAVIEELAGERKHEFVLERAVFLTVLHRLFAGGSERAADRWREDYRIDGVEGLDLHHLYRAMAWLGEELPADQQDGRTLAPRCLKDVMEERLFASTANANSVAMPRDPPPPPRHAQNRSGFVAALADTIVPAAVTRVTAFKLSHASP